MIRGRHFGMHLKTRVMSVRIKIVKMVYILGFVCSDAVLCERVFWSVVWLL